MGETRDRPLTHFRFGNADHHGLVGPDHYPRIDFRSADCGRSAVGTKGKFEAEREPSAAGSAADNERAAIHLRSVIHGILPLHAFVTA